MRGRREVIADAEVGEVTVVLGGVRRGGWERGLTARGGTEMENMLITHTDRHTHTHTHTDRHTHSHTLSDDQGNDRFTSSCGFHVRRWVVKVSDIWMLGINRQYTFTS